MDTDFIYTPKDFLGWALDSGWSPGTMPVGVVFTFQSPVTRSLAEQPERFAPNRDLIVSNGSSFMTADGGSPVLVSCLAPGAASMVTQLEHLRLLAGDAPLAAAIVGTAGAISPAHAIADTVVAEAALATDGVSTAYGIEWGTAVSAHDGLTAALTAGLDDAPRVRSWSVAVPYRSSPADLEWAQQHGAEVVEMEAAALFAAATVLDVPAAAAVVISDVHRVDEPWSVDWSDTTPPLLRALDASIDAIRTVV